MTEEHATDTHKEETQTLPQTQADPGLPAVSGGPAPELGNINPKDITMPRVQLLQLTSPAIAEGAVEGIKAGDIVNSLTLQKIEGAIVPVTMYKSWIRFNPRKSSDRGWDPKYGPGDVIYQTTDENDPRLEEDAQWVDDEHGNSQKPLTTEFINFLVIVKGCNVPLILGFANTSYKTGKKMLSVALMLGGKPWDHRYSLKSKKVTGDEGIYYVWEVEASGTSSAEEKALAQRMYEVFGQKVADIKVHEPEREQSQAVEPETTTYE